MKRMLIMTIPIAFLCCLILAAKVYAASNSDLEIQVTSPIESLQSESGVVAVAQFPAEIAIKVMAQTGVITDIRLEYGGHSQTITPDYTLMIESKEACGPFTIAAETDQGAVLTITANVVFQVKAAYDTRYRTIGMNVKEIYEGGKLIKSFPVPQLIKLNNANTVAGQDQERIAGWIGKCDGGTYTLKGSLVAAVHNISTGKAYGIYDTNTDFAPLTTSFGWTPQTLIAFATMQNAEITYQAPVNINVKATWCSEDKQEVYGKLSAEDKGVPELLFPYQTTAVTFSKDDIPLSRNFVYLGLEWDYTPESAEYADGESRTQTFINQKINYKILAANFYFKFKKQDADDLSVMINAPATVYRGDSYSFTVTFVDSGTQPAYDVPLRGKVDENQVREIPAKQDFSPNESKTYTIKRKADTPADVIHLWANIGVPEGFIDSNLSNNTATTDIQVVDKPAPEPAKTPEPKDNPDQPVSPVPQEDKPPILPKLCDLSASIIAPPTVYEHESYSFTVSFTNQSDLEVANAILRGTNNDAVLPQIPGTCSFRPQETKTFAITGTAGNAGEIYNLWANIAAPDGFRDENPANNTAVSKITVVKKPSGNPPDQPNNPPANPPNKPDSPPAEPPGNPNNPPQNPDNPVNPINPVTPPEKLCDVWTNLSSPPTVYEHEEYSFTVYFANSTGKALSGVRLNASIDGKEVSSVPPQADFQANETKAFLIKSTAGEKGTTIHLAAQVSSPIDYRDTDMSNNQAAAEIAVVERPYDLDVQRITPDQYKENQTVISTIKVSNSGSKDFTPGEKVSVLFEIPELSLKKRVDAVVMEQNTWNIVAVKWDTPDVQADQNITLIATINPDRVLSNETSFANNTYTQKAVIKDVTYDEPEESRTIPAPPERSDKPKVTWWEQRYENGQFVWRQFYAELDVTAVLDYATKAKGYLKSGYGFFIDVTATVNTNYDRPELITPAQTTEVYLPQYRYETAIPLISDSPNHFTFRENPNSPFRYKKEYIPVWFPDITDYIVQLLVTDVHTPGGTLSKWITGGDLKINVVDSMYSDDATTAE